MNPYSHCIQLTNADCDCSCKYQHCQWHFNSVDTNLTQINSVAHFFKLLDYVYNRTQLQRSSIGAINWFVISNLCCNSSDENRLSQTANMACKKSCIQKHTILGFQTTTKDVIFTRLLVAIQTSVYTVKQPVKCAFSCWMTKIPASFSND